MKSLTPFVGAVGAVLIGCGSAPSPRRAEGELPGLGKPVAARPLKPLALEVAVLTARGELTVEQGGRWRPLAAGASLVGVREIKVARQGAIVALGTGDAAGRLWLRGGSHVRVGQDDRGGVHLVVLAGQARLRRGDAAMPAFVDGGGAATPITGDFLLQAAAAGRTELVPTGARPELADWALELEHAELGAGVGRMEARIDADHSEPLELRKVAVDVHTAGDLAVTEVEHVFFNPADQNREGTFRFPVPSGAMLIGMAMEVNGVMVEGEIVDREKARETYEKIVDEMLDPALLEWEEGNWFKLRVFPIEAHDDKKVVIRYVTPLTHRGEGWEYDFALGVPDLGAPIGELSVTVDGKVATRERAVKRGLDLAVPVATGQVPAVMQEVRADGVYTAVRITPDAKALAVPAPGAARRIAVVFDTSRSTLESRPLALDLLRTTLGELASGDRFVVLASDVAVIPSAPDFVAAKPDAIARAVAFVDGIEPDGASDLGGALAAAAALHPTDVLYIGDGIATWGERGGPALAAAAEAIGAPIHAALLGKGATAAPWSDLAGRTGGRAMIVTRPIDAQRFALAAAHAREVPRLSGARVLAPEGASVFPDHATTVYAGDQLLAVIRTPAGAPAPTELTLTGQAGGAAYRQTVSLAAAAITPRVAQRWAQHQLAVMEEAGAPREDIVALSRDAGVLSRYTSLLVLENDEAYKQHQIERKQAEVQLAQAAPQVTGGDLDSLGARQASLSPDEIQPGDPEIKIPAPRDAVSVVVTFPFGETKQAVWDGDLSAWMVRFLIDKDTLDGEYQVRVAITHADGRVEVLQLGYTVDTRAPEVDLTATRVAGGYRIRARQRATDGGRRDADKIEVVLPDGQLLVLAQTAWGKFEAVWTTDALLAPVTLRVVVRDHALNQAVDALTVAP